MLSSHSNWFTQLSRCTGYSLFKPIRQFSKAAQPLSYNDVPGPKSEPGYGCWKEFQELGGHLDIYEVLKTFRKRYGDIVRLDLPGYPQVVVFHPDDIQKVYENEGKYPMNSTLLWPFNEFNKHYFGSLQANFAAREGEEWKKLRNILQKDMFSPKEAAEYLPLTHGCTREAVEAFPQWVKERHALYYPIVSFDLLQHIIYNSGLGVWKGDFDSSPVKDIYIKGIRAFAKMFELGFVPQDQADPNEIKSFFEDMTVVFDLLGDLLKEARQSTEVLAKSSVKPYLLKLMDRGELAEKDYLTNTASLLFAAFDTTANTISWLIYNIARSPQAQEKLYEEINKVKSGGPLLKEHLSSIPYLKACVKENARISPVAAYNIRKLPVDINLQGYNIPVGIQLDLHTASSYCLDPNVYEKPFDFVPDRWTKEAKSQRKLENTLHDHPYMILPFSIGPRMCMGARLAEIEIYVFISELIQKYKISLASDSPIPRQLSTGTTKAEPLPKYVVENRN